jgi:hypothetical protein
MHYAPREIIAASSAGMFDRVLKSNTSQELTVNALKKSADCVHFMCENLTITWDHM